MNWNQSKISSRIFLATATNLFFLLVLGIYSLTRINTISLENSQFIIGLLLISVVVFITMATALANSIGRPLQEISQNIQEIAEGRIPDAIKNKEYGGDFLPMSQHLNTCTASLRGLLDEMNHMSKEHEEGDIDVIIDIQKFQGEFRSMAKGINEMVRAHIATKKQALDIVDQFGEGNFDAPLEKLPGKKAFINNIIEKIRGNLKGLVSEMNRMSDEHEKGDIDVIIAVEKFQGEFRSMAGGINKMVRAHIATKKRALDIVDQFGEGN
ncbi:MAG: HAMP domain-containing protein, partial [Spirochaetota bacterium]